MKESNKKDAVYDRDEDGNCQFSAIVSALNQQGIFHRSAGTLREEARNNPSNVEGIPLEFFVSRLSEEYLNEMLLDGTYGDQITLQAISDLLGIKLTINLGVEGSVVIFTTSAITSSHITLAISLKEWGFTTLL